MNAYLAQILYTQPRLLILAVFVVLAAGTSAWLVIPRLEDPASSVRGAQIITLMDGAAADRIESLITRKIEDAIREERYIKTLISDSRESVSSIIVLLADDVKDVETVWTRVQNKLAEVTPELPPDASTPELIRSEWGAYSLFVALSWCNDSPVNHSAMARLSDELERRLQYVGGTSHVRSFGVAEEEISVRVDPFELAAMNLSVDKIGKRIIESDSKVASGLRLGTQTQISLDVAGELNQIDQVKNIPIHSPESDSSMRLGDIARVEMTIASPIDSIVTTDGRRAVVVAARAFSSIQIERWAERVDQTLTEFASTLPVEVQVSKVFEQSKFTQQRWETLVKNLSLGLISIVAVVWLLMGFRAMVPIVLALPFSIAATLFLMAVFGVSLQQISFIGIVIALGMLIDNPIIVVDELQQRHREPVTTAIPEMVRTLGVPLTGSALTTVLAFGPLMLIDGPTGEFVWTLGAAVILAILSSLGLAIWLVPAVAARLGSANQFSDGILARPLYWIVDKLVRVALWAPLLGILVPIVISAGGFYVAQFLPEQFFPPAERNQIRLQLRLPRSSTVQETAQQCQRASDVLKSFAQVRHVTWFIGSNAPPYYYNLIGGGDNSPYLAEALIEIDNHAAIKPLAIAAQARLDQTMLASQAVIRQVEQGPAVMAPIEVRIYGNDLTQIDRLGDELRRIMSLVPGILHTRATIANGQPVMKFDVNETVSLKLNLLAREIANQLTHRTRGLAAGTFVDGTEEFPIRVKLTEPFRESWQNILAIPVERTDGRRQSAMVRTIAEPELLPEFGSISHYNGRRCNLVRAFLVPGALPASVLKDLKKQMKAQHFRLPNGCEIEFGGDDEERNNAVQKLLAYSFVICASIFAVLVWTVSSFRLATTVAIVGALSVGYALGASYFSGYPFGFMSIVGTMGMIGIAVNDSVVVISALRMSFRDSLVTAVAVRAVVVKCSRHVLATTLTTTFGFLPLLLSNSEFWSPVAIVIIGGVVGATGLSLVFVPAVFLLMYRTRRQQNADVVKY